MQEGQASITAQRVAARRLGFDRVPADHGDPDADQRLQADVAGGVAVAGETPMSRHLAVRTMFFDRVVVGALERGIEQVVIAAAGYDGRALRYRRDGVRWFELDHPATQADKRARLERLGLDTSGITFVAADFTVDDVAGGLSAAGLSKAKPALVTVEGLAVYLDRPVLAGLLSQLRAACGSESRLAISMSLDNGSITQRVRRAAFRARVASIGEPARTILTPEDSDRLMGDAGWQAVPVAEGERGERARSAGLIVARAI